MPNPDGLLRLPAFPFYHTVKGGLPAAGSLGAAGIVRDCYLAHAAEFGGANKLVMGHTALVKGAGSYGNGIEKPRIEVVLATRIPPERCHRISLGYVDPATIKPQEWMGREEEGVLVIPRAGEVLYRPRS